MDLEVVSRAEARERGLRCFFTGVPCVNGHLVHRRVSNGQCSACAGIAHKKCRLKDPTAFLRASRKWRLANPTYHKEYMAARPGRREKSPVSGHDVAVGPTLPRTYSEARSAKSARYYTGEPCQHGHFSVRLLSNQSCLQCSDARKRARREREKAIKPPERHTVLQVLHDGPVISRKEARLLGLRRFFTGTACEWDHVAERHVASNGCYACNQANQKAFAQERPDYVKQRAKKYQTDARREYARLRAAERFADDPAKVRADAKARRLRNPEIYRTNVRNRRARRDGAEGSFTHAEFMSIMERQRWRCAYCRRKLTQKTVTADHIVPLVSGGSNYATNIQGACGSCNKSKGPRDPLVFARSLGLLL